MPHLEADRLYVLVLVLEVFAAFKLVSARQGSPVLTSESVEHHLHLCCVTLATMLTLNMPRLEADRVDDTKFFSRKSES